MNRFRTLALFVLSVQNAVALVPYLFAYHGFTRGNNPILLWLKVPVFLVPGAFGVVRSPLSFGSWVLYQSPNGVPGKLRTIAGAIPQAVQFGCGRHFAFSSEKNV